MAARRLPRGVALGVIAALIGSAAVAAIPDSGGRISACYAIKDGLLRVIDTGAGQSCTDLEMPLSWSSTADITGVNAGLGLTGGASAGEASLSVNTDQIQARIGKRCPLGEFMVAVAVSGDVICEAPAGGSGSGGTGDITAVGAGTGLLGGGTSGDVSLGVNFKSVQARVANECPINLFMVGIQEGGEPSCGAISTRDELPAVSRYRYRGRERDFLPGPELARVRLQPGAWVVLAKVTVHDRSGQHQIDWKVNCRLTGGSDRDEVRYSPANYWDRTDIAPTRQRRFNVMKKDTQLSLMIAHAFTESGDVVLDCELPDNPFVPGIISFDQIRVTAIPVPGVNVSAL